MKFMQISLTVASDNINIGKKKVDNYNNFYATQSNPKWSLIRNASAELIVKKIV